MPANDEYVFIVIPARKNSKRLKNKNIKDFEGFPLFEWSIAAALFIKNKLSSFGLTNIEIICTSNDKRILARVLEKYSDSVNAVSREEKLSGDNITLEAVIIQAVEAIINKNDRIKLKNGKYILLQPTSPIRAKIDLANFCKRFRETKTEFSLLSVNENYHQVEDIYSLQEINDNSDHRSWIIENKIDFRGKASKKSAFIDGSLYSGGISSLGNNTFIPKGKALVFFQSIPWSVDIDTSKNFNEAVDALSVFKNKGFEFVEPEI